MIIVKEKFLREMSTQLETEKESLVRGAGENYSEVQYLRGRISGLEHAIETFTELWKKAVNSEDFLE